MTDKEFAMKKGKAFTRIELLIVVIMIALLLSIIVPTLRQVKHPATGTVYLSDIRPLAIAWHTYSFDHNAEFIHSYIFRSTAPYGYDPKNPCWVCSTKCDRSI